MRSVRSSTRPVRRLRCTKNDKGGAQHTNGSFPTVTKVDENQDDQDANTARYDIGDIRN